MRRAVVLTVSITAVVALAWAWAAAPNTAAVEKGKAKVAEVPAAPGKATIVDKLFKRAKFAAIPKDKNTNLKDVLDKLAKETGVTFEINEGAFRMNPLDDASSGGPLQSLSAPIFAARGLPARESTLAFRLKEVLGRVPENPGLTFMVRRDHVEITTGAEQAAEALPPQPFAALPGAPGGFNVGGFGAVGAIGAPGGLMIGMPGGGGLQIGGLGGLGMQRGARVPLVSLMLEGRPLRDALKAMGEQVHLNIVLDPRAAEKAKAPVSATLLNAPLDSALFLLAEMAELRAVRLDNTFVVTTPERAKALEDAWQSHAKKGRTLEGPPPGPAEPGPGPGM